MSKTVNQQAAEMVSLAKKLEPIEAEILQEQGLGKRSYIETWEHYRRIGTLLREAKTILPHGQFTPWHTSKFGFSPQHAGRCMRVAENYDALQPQIEQESSVWDALAALSSNPKHINPRHVSRLDLPKAPVKARGARPS